MATTTRRELISLVLPTTLHVIGEFIEGEVLLNFSELQNTQIEELHVKLRASVFTYARCTHSVAGRPSDDADRGSMICRQITRQQGQTSVTSRQRVDLIRQNVSLWARGSAYPPAGTDVLRLPFRFTLNPSQQLPSAHYAGSWKRGGVGYSVEVVGVRTGLHFDKRLSLPLSVLPPDTKGASLSQELRSGLVSAWQSIEFKKDIRKGIWGEYSKVHATVSQASLHCLLIEPE